MHLPLQFGARTLLVDAEIAGQRDARRAARVAALSRRTATTPSSPIRSSSTSSAVMERHLGFGHGVHLCIGAHSPASKRS